MPIISGLPQEVSDGKVLKVMGGTVGGKLDHSGYSMKNWVSFQQHLFTGLIYNAFH